jgi:large subunit ribosomal protein L25
MDMNLSAVRRESRGKNEARRLRAAGRIPAVVYGGGDKAQADPIAVDPKALLRILHSESGANTLIALSVESGGDTRVLVKDYQLDPITGQLLHADFYRVAMDRMLTLTVPVVIRGEARGVKQQGGILDFVHREVEVECLPGDIPENIEVDVSELMLGQGVRLRDVAEGVKWKAVSDPDTLLLHIVAPRVEEAPAAAAAVETGAAPSEPEVIKKGKAEKEEE